MSAALLDDLSRVFLLEGCEQDWIEPSEGDRLIEISTELAERAADRLIE